MSQSTVTRNGQVTLTKEIREKLNISEGDIININIMGESVIISKKDVDVWDKINSFLPENFEKVLSDLRGDTSLRLKRLGIYE